MTNKQIQMLPNWFSSRHWKTCFLAATVCDFHPINFIARPLPKDSTLETLKIRTLTRQNLDYFQCHNRLNQRELIWFCQYPTYHKWVWRGQKTPVSYLKILILKMINVDKFKSRLNIYNIVTYESRGYPISPKQLNDKNTCYESWWAHTI